MHGTLEESSVAKELACLPDIQNAQGGFLDKKNCCLKAIPNSVDMEKVRIYVGGLLNG